MPTPQLNIRVPERDRQAWLEAARRAGLDLSNWIRQTCNKAASPPPCRHKRKRAGTSGVLVCADCGKVNP